VFKKIAGMEKFCPIWDQYNDYYFWQSLPLAFFLKTRIMISILVYLHKTPILGEFFLEIIASDPGRKESKRIANVVTTMLQDNGIALNNRVTRCGDFFDFWATIYF
jgi:hypothetical protein